MEKGTLIYPGHRFKPADFLEFIYTRIFDRVWRQLGLNDDEDRWLLEAAIMLDPKGWPVVSGTGGGRKMRFAPPDWPTGQSGALRAIYRHYEGFHVSAVAIVYPKGVKDDLSKNEKKSIKKAFEEIEAELRK